MGPSPRARGIQDLSGQRFGRLGSIPACAGNPLRLPGDGEIGQVHPRVRGESGAGTILAAAEAGPSPRARGIRTTVEPGRGMVGSIPACAGNPLRQNDPSESVLLLSSLQRAFACDVFDSTGGCLPSSGGAATRVARREAPGAASRWLSLRPRMQWRDWV